MARVGILYGGTNVQYQRELLTNGCTVLVATPGRLHDFIDREFISVSQVRLLVLDEADRLLDLGFESVIRKLVELPDMPDKNDRQTLMFSATFPEGVQTLAREFLKPSHYAFIAIGTIGAANSCIKQQVLEVEFRDKKDRLLELLGIDMDTYKMDPNSAVYCQKTLVFVETKKTADIIAMLLSNSKLKSTSLHGDRDQSQREAALRVFQFGEIPILIATAVASRGLDIKGVDHVINFDMPKNVDEYVHRIGRTGRVGNSGRATSFYDPGSDSGMAADLVRIIIDAEQEVPSFLSDSVGINTNSTGYGGQTAPNFTSSQFGGDGFKDEDGW